jgi:hypothetical protein
MQWLTAPLRFAQSALLGTFRPPADASVRQNRVHGAVCVGLGLLLFLAAGALMFSFESHAAPSLAMKIGVAPLLVAYALVIVGGYRVLAGREPGDEASTAGASARRIAVGVLAVVLAMALLFALILLAGWTLGLE